MAIIIISLQRISDIKMAEEYLVLFCIKENISVSHEFLYKLHTLTHFKTSPRHQSIK